MSNTNKVLSGQELAVGYVYILEKLERFHSASSVGEEQPQVILCHILSVKVNVTFYSPDMVTLPSSLVALLLTGCWRGGVWQMVGRCSESSWSLVF